jgi:hypothetical protein
MRMKRRQRAVAPVLRGAAGRDLMQGGAGDDGYYVDNVGDVVDESVAGSSGIDTVYASFGFNLSNATAIRGCAEELVLRGRGNIMAPATRFTTPSSATPATT